MHQQSILLRSLDTKVPNLSCMKLNVKVLELPCSRKLTVSLKVEAFLIILFYLEISGIEFFQVRISLTRLGLKDWKQVLRLLFEYIKMLQTLPPNLRYWKEIVHRKSMVFEYHEQRASLKTVNQIVNKMSTFEPRDIISGSANMR